MYVTSRYIWWCISTYLTLQSVLKIRYQGCTVYCCISILWIVVYYEHVSTNLLTSLIVVWIMLYCKWSQVDALQKFILHLCKVNKCFQICKNVVTVFDEIKMQLSYYDSIIFKRKHHKSYDKLFFSELVIIISFILMLYQFYLTVLRLRFQLI